MGSPIVFSGKRSKLLSSKGLLYSNGSINDYNGDINYILNGHAEVNTAGWATYADAAQATPVNGTGGSANVTWTQTTTAPLDDLASFVFTKDAVNRQGQGASYDFTIDSASQAKVMTITFDYIIGSGTFTAGSKTTDSDIEVYIYDVTNSVLIQPSTYKLYSNSSTVPTQFISNFQTPYNSTSYRLIFHCATTSASAYTVKFDNVKVSPTQYTYGTPITDWQDLPSVAAGTLVTSTGTSPTFGTIAVNKAQWRRVGGNAEFRWTFRQTTAGTAGTATYLWNIPASIGTIDTTKVSVNTSGSLSTVDGGVGYFNFTDGTFVGNGSVGVYSTSQLKVTNLTWTSSASGYTVGAWAGSGATSFANANYNVVMLASVPILGWSSCVQMSDNAAQNIVSAKYTGNNAATSGNPIIGQTLQWDTSGSYSLSTGKFTVPVAGYYQVTMMYNNTGNLTYTVYLDAVSKEVISLSNASGLNQGTSTIYCNAGQTLDVRPSGTMGAVAGSSNQSWVTYTKVTGPASIAATDTVAASYWLSANFAASTTVPINFDSKEFDYTGAVTTSATAWKFTAPIAGLYQISGLAMTTAGATAGLIIYKNGSAYKAMTAMNATVGYRGPYATEIKLLAGDYIDLRPSGSFTMQGGTLSTTDTCTFAISKVGNN